MIPNFLIIGAQKAGTTSLLRYLGAHPEIFVPEDKEVSPFYGDCNYNKRFKNYPYEKYFESWAGEKFAGNGPANLLYFSEPCAARIYEYNPSMKLIAILRNPIERAYSAYWYFVRTGFETASFESALKREKSIMKSGSFSQKANLTYVSHGYYYEQILNFYKVFKKDQLLVLFFDDLKAGVKDVLKKIYLFLDIEEYYPMSLLEKKFNVGSKSRIQPITNLIYHDSFIKTIYKAAFPATLRHYLSNRFVRKIRDLNNEPFNYPEMKHDTRAELKNLFELPNQKLADLLGRDLSH